MGWEWEFQFTLHQTTIHKTSFSMSFSKISKFSAMIPKLNTYFLYHQVIPFKRDKNLGNFLVRSAFKFNNQPGTFTGKRKRCKTSPFISNTVKIWVPNQSVKVTDHFTCISTNVIFCITCTLCKKIYIGETGRRLVDRLHEHRRDAEQNNKVASKPVACHFNLPNHSHHNMTICGLSLHHGNKNSFFNWVHSLHTELVNASHFTNLFTNLCDHISTNGKARLHSRINHNNPQFLYSLGRRAHARNISFLNLSRLLCNLYQLVW